MTNEQKEQRLEQMAKWADKNALQWKDHAVNCGSHPRESEGCMAISEAESAAAALLRECAGMMRERGGVQWGAWSTGVAAVYKRRIICIEDWKLPAERRFRWDVGGPDFEYAFGYADSLEAAQAAAVAWVDEREGQ